MPVAGGIQVKVNQAFAAGGGLDNPFPLINSANTQVIFEAHRETVFIPEIFSVPINGGTVVTLNQPLVAGQVASSPQISPDGSQVLYRANQDSPTMTEVYIVPVGGGASLKINEELRNGTGAGASFAPSGRWVLYTANLMGETQAGLYGVSPTGGEAAQRNY